MDHVLALDDSGRVWAFGGNDYGQLGNGTLSTNRPPEIVEGVTDVVSVAAGAGHSLALRKDGKILAWGFNVNGELGIGSKDALVAKPAIVEFGEGAVEIAAGGNHSLLLTERGEVWAWGKNANGQLGDGTTHDRDQPTRVMAIEHAVRIFAGPRASAAIVTR